MTLFGKFTLSFHIYHIFNLCKIMFTHGWPQSVPLHCHSHLNLRLKGLRALSKFTSWLLLAFQLGKPPLFKRISSRNLLVRLLSQNGTFCRNKIRMNNKDDLAKNAIPWTTTSRLLKLHHVMLAITDFYNKLG